MTDRLTVRIVAFGLALMLVGYLVSATICALAGVELPGDVADLAKVAIGALGGLLANTRSDEVPAPVTVVNESRDPIPVEQTPAVEPVAKPKR